MTELESAGLSSRRPTFKRPPSPFELKKDSENPSIRVSPPKSPEPMESDDEPSYVDQEVVDKLHRQVLEQDREIASLRDQSEEYIIELDQSQEEISALEKQISALRKVIEGLETKLDYEQQQFTSMQDEKDQEIEHQKVLLNESQTKIIDLEKQVASITYQVEISISTQQNLSQSLNLCKEELEAFKIMHAETVARHEQLQASLLDQLASKDSSIQQLQSRLESTNSEIKVLEHQLSSLTIPLEDVPLDGPTIPLQDELRMNGFGLSRTTSMNSVTSIATQRDTGMLPPMRTSSLKQLRKVLPCEPVNLSMEPLTEQEKQYKRMVFLLQKQNVKLMRELQKLRSS